MGCVRMAACSPAAHRWIRWVGIGGASTGCLQGMHRGKQGVAGLSKDAGRQQGGVGCATRFRSDGDDGVRWSAVAGVASGGSCSGRGGIGEEDPSNSKETRMGRRLTVDKGGDDKMAKSGGGGRGGGACARTIQGSFEGVSGRQWGGQEAAKRKK
jgi:hypothetical protein